MENSVLFNQIIIKLRTKADVAAVISCMQEFADSFFSTKSLQKQQQIFAQLPNGLADIFIKEFAQKPITPETQIPVKRRLDELETALKNCQPMQLTIAFQPDEETITYFSDWIKKNIRPDILIDIQFDKMIVGGALLIASGIYKDYSIRKALSHKFQMQRDDIIELLI
jgi:hypothetical protein